MDGLFRRGDPQPPPWDTPEIHAAADQGRTGEVIRLAREATRLTLKELGERCGYSTSAMSRIERGKSSLDSITVRRRIAEALKVPAELLGLARLHGHATTPNTSAVASTAARLPPKGIPEGDEMRRRTLITMLPATGAAIAGLPTTPAAATHGLPWLLTDDDQAGPIPTHAAAARLAAARRDFAASRHTEVVRALPPLLNGLRAAVSQVGTDLDAGTVLARAYVLAAAVSTKLGDDTIAWVLADRALSVARATGDGVTIAAAAHRVAIAMRRAGHYDSALKLLIDTAVTLDADRGGASLDLIGAYGNLLCTAAFTGAQASRATTAAALLSEARAAAARLDAATVVTGGVVPFCTSTVDIYAIGVHTALGDSASALTVAASVEPAQLPTAERYGRYCVDTARAWSRHGRPDRAAQALLCAEQHAHGEVARPAVRDLVSTLLYAPTPTPPGLRDLAQRLGMLS